jgi:hypothetical protein
MGRYRASFLDGLDAAIFIAVSRVPAARKDGFGHDVPSHE